MGGEVVPGERSRPTKAPLVDESKDGPPLAQPQDLVPPIGSRREEDIEMDAVQGILYLSKCFLVLILLLCCCFLLVLKLSLASFLQVT